MRAVVGPGKPQVVAKRTEGEEYRDRQRLEQKTMVTDELNEYYRQTWYHADSGEEHSKTGRVDDRDMHGSRSASKVKKTIRPVD